MKAVQASSPKDCRFLMKKSADSASECILNILWQPNGNLEWLRTKLRTAYNVPKDRSIFYIDDDGDKVPIDSECELQEAFKLSRNMDGPIQLIVGSFEDTSDKYLGYHETFLPSSIEQQARIIEMQSKFDVYNSYSYSSLESFMSHLLEQDSVKKNVSPTIVAKQDKSNETNISRTDEEVESKVDIQEEAKASSQQYLNCTSPPQWFTEYMESLKEDMMSTITDEVVQNIMEALNKRLDTFMFSLLMELDSAEARHLQWASDSKEKDQQKTKFQEKEQLTDVPIKRTDEPRSTKDVQIKKDVIATITNDVLKEVTDLLNKAPLDELVPVPSKDQSRNQSHLPSSTLSRYSFDSHSSEKNQKSLKSRLAVFEQTDDDAPLLKTDELIWPTCICDNSARQSKKTHDLKDAFRTQEKKKKIREYMEEEGKQFAQMDNAKDFVFTNQSRTERGSNEVVHLEAPKPIENNLRMSCSVTGNQMLDEGRLSKDTLHNLYFISDNASFCSCDYEEKRKKEKEEDDDAFEIIQMPASNDELLFAEPAIEQQHDSSRDSPSFELLSEPPSPPSSIHLNEDHFSADEEKLEQRSRKTNSPNSVYMVDIQDKIFNDAHRSVNVDERVSVDSKKQPDVTYTFVMDEEIPSTKEARSSKLCMQRMLNERKYLENARNRIFYLKRPAANLYNSKSQYSCNTCKSLDSSDFEQSFHSHTTSMTDNDLYLKHNTQNEDTTMINDDVREDVTTFPAKSMANPWDEHDIQVDGGWTKETNEKHRHDKCPTCSYAEHSCASNNSYPFNRDNPSLCAYQPCEAGSKVSRSSDRSCSNVGSRKTSAGELSTADSVHILPETLISAAAQVGSFAFDAAREVLDKLRAHTKEDTLKKSRGGVKCENKKPVSHLPFY